MNTVLHTTHEKSRACQTARVTDEERLGMDFFLVSLEGKVIGASRGYQDKIIRHNANTSAVKFGVPLIGRHSHSAITTTLSVLPDPIGQVLLNRHTHELASGANACLIEKLLNDSLYRAFRHV